VFDAGRISDLESQLSEAQDDLANLQESLNQEVSELSARTKQEINRDRDGLDARIMALSKENETFKLEVSYI
jgi:predicted transcriptional regulator